ncbi:Ig-like domain-containing protein [Kangiella shandongensis]|uniref:Ig-like domain-containing protein n=1 Tax=Kangiella shandongensis TaxID=2763258 RepID=UPI001CBCDA56|nr:Ig-like domain-containing protein [Kangiella shandongensis]
MKKLFFLACALLLPKTGFSVEGTLIDTESRYGLGPFFDVAYYGNTAYAVDGNDSLIVLDVTDSSAISLTDTVDLGCSSSDLDIDGTTLVVRCPFKLKFFDVTDSSAPVPAGTYDSSGYAVNSVKLSGDRLYMVGGNSDLAIFDTSDLSSIQEINTQTFGSLGNVSKLKKAGDYLYVSSDFQKVRAFDITDENLVKEFTLAETVGTTFYDASIVADTLYIGAGNGLHIYDISDVANPVFVTNVNSGSSFESIDTLKTLHVIGNKLFAGKYNGWIFQFNISSANSATFEEDTKAGTHEVYGFANSENILMVAYGIDGLRTLDISAEALPFMDSLGSYRESIIPVDLSLSNQRLLVSDETGLFHILDINKDLSFTEKSRMPTIVGINTQAGEINGNIGWLGVEKQLETRDFTTLNPSSLLDSQTASSTGFVTFLKELGNMLYLGTNNGVIALYDVSSDVPSLVSTVTLPLAESGARQYITEITPYGDFVLASSLDSELLAVDFSDTENPSVVSVPKFSDTVNAQLFVTGDMLLSVSNSGAVLIDISVLSSANYIREIPELGLITAATNIDSSTVLLSSNNGLLAVDISDSEDIRVISQIEGASSFSNLTYDGSKVVGSVIYENELHLYEYNLYPKASDSSFTLDEDSVLSDILVGSDPEGDELTFALVTETENGSVSINASGQFTYEPVLNFNGQDSFTYSVEDTHGGRAEATVVLTANAINDTPTANDMSVSTKTETSVSGSFDASDVDNDELSYQYTNPSNGSLNVSGSEFTYTPDSDFSGEDSFDYTVTDPSGASATATVSISVTNNAPTANNVSLTTKVDSSVSGTFNATDPDGDELAVEYTSPSSGTLNVSGTSFTYTPDSGFSGKDTFQYTVTDPYGESATATVNISVNQESSGGGGSSDWLLLLILGFGFVAGRRVR